MHLSRGRRCLGVVRERRQRVPAGEVGDAFRRLASWRWTPSRCQRSAVSRSTVPRAVTRTSRLGRAWRVRRTQPLGSAEPRGERGPSTGEHRIDGLSGGLLAGRGAPSGPVRIDRHHRRVRLLLRPQHPGRGDLRRLRSGDVCERARSFVEKHPSAFEALARPIDTIPFQASR